MVFVFNAQSVIKKMEELRAIATMENPDIIAITETWANEAIGDAHLKINGYEMVAREDRKDTSGGRGGGIIIHARKELHVWKVEASTEFNQMAAIQLRCGCVDVKLHVIYRSPNSNGQNDASLNEYIGAMRGTNVLTGDFNLPDIDWANGLSGARGRKFFEVATECSLEQHVEEATHISGNTLDLVLSDKEGLKLCHDNGKSGQKRPRAPCISGECGQEKQQQRKTKTEFQKGNVRRNEKGG